MLGGPIQRCEPIQNRDEFRPCLFKFYHKYLRVIKEKKRIGQQVNVRLMFSIKRDNEL